MTQWESMELSDETILELQDVLAAANAGDAAAFDQLIRRFESRFRTLATQMMRKYPRLRRWEETDDVFQAVSIRLHRSLTDAKPDSIRQFVGLSATQTRRTLIDLSRHYFGSLGKGRNHQTEGGGRAADDPGGAVDRSSKGSGEPISMEQWSEFHEAVENLPRDAKETFELIWYTGLKQEEAAKLLNVSRRTIIRRVNEARMLLGEALQ
jgi:RNA polymerase sigma-70 factor (ECF subfamily)